MTVQSTQSLLGVFETFGHMSHVEYGVRLHRVILGAALEDVDDLAVATFAVSDGVDDWKGEFPFRNILAVPFCLSHLPRRRNVNIARE